MLSDRRHVLFLKMHTAIPYRASTGPEQGFPCVVFPHRENPVFISWDPCNENRFFLVGNTTQGKPCSHYRDGFAVRNNISYKPYLLSECRAKGFPNIETRVHI